MEEENKENEEEAKRKADEEAKAKEKAGADGDPDKGNKYETTPLIERARVEREKLDEANKKKEELLNREEAIMAKRALGGGSEAGSAPEKPKKLTDEEYAEAVEKGEANPLKEDGYI